MQGEGVGNSLKKKKKRGLQNVDKEMVNADFI